ncbi:MAG: hypothetical protein GWP69_10695 [Gammaproteobacteria bacterium]|jgi:hypothetical protein|nr:hypothetical protein [Gammaproteobacteria bacterium]
MDAPRRSLFTSSIAPRLWLPVILALLLMPATAMARDDADNPNRPDDLTPAEIAEPEEPEAPWVDTAIPLPTFPRAQDLLPIRGDAGDPDYNYYIDVNSVSFTSSEVLRYTVVIQSPRGASNIIYEGIRCATREIKTLAYGTKGGRFARMPEPKWEFIYFQGALGYRMTLVERYICDENGWAMDRDTVLERLVMHDPRRPRVVPKEAASSD